MLLGAFKLVSQIKNVLQSLTLISSDLINVDVVESGIDMVYFYTADYRISQNFDHKQMISKVDL